MPLSSGTTLVKGSLAWTMTKTVTGFTAVSQKDDVAFSFAPDASTYNHAYVSEFTLAAAATSTIDLSSFTNLVGEAATITKLIGLCIQVTATVTGGQLKIEAGAANPASPWLSGTTPALTVSVGTGLKAGILIMDGAAYTISGTQKNIKFSNPGSQTITVDLAVLLGT